MRLNKKLLQFIYNCLRHFDARQNRVINATGTYTVNLNSKTISVDSLLLNDSGATLSQSGYTLSSGSTTVSSGTLAGGAVLAAATANSTLAVTGSGILNVANATGLAPYGAYIEGNAVVNDGTIQGNDSQPSVVPIVLNIDPNTFTNHGTVSAANGTSVLISATTWSSDGQITADGISPLEFSGAWSNTGTVTIASGGSLDLGGTFATASVAGITATGASTTISGAMDNSNAAFVDDGTLGSVSVVGSITCGSVEVKPNQTLVMGSSSAYQATPTITSAVTIDSNATLSGYGSIGGASLVNNGSINAIGALNITSTTLTNSASMTST